MVNSEDFSKRLEQIMDRHDLNASSFAEQVGVGRSSISHLLSGRNKPSLDFVLSVLKQFTDVDLYWFLNGKGTYPKSLSSDQSFDSIKSEKQTEPVVTTTPKENISENITLEEENDFKDSAESLVSIQSKKGKNITKVILFYDDGTFESFNP